MVIWITGKAGSGKTTTAKSLASVINKAVIIDAYEFRRQFADGDFTDEGRRNSILRIARVGAILEDQGFVPIIVCVSPTKSVRNEARQLFKESMIIYVPGGNLWKGTSYEEPDSIEIRGLVGEIPLNLKE